MRMNGEENHNRDSAFLNAALDAIISMDSSGNIIELNPSAERMFGVKRKEVLGHEMAAIIIPPRFREAHRQGLSNYIKR